MSKPHQFKIDKLIRDKLPELMRESGITVFERTMEPEEYLKRLKDKLLEEAKEVSVATQKPEIQEELADLFEVMTCLARMYDIAFEEIIKTAGEKKSKKGGFEKRIYGAFVEVNSGHPSLSYYRARPDEYPEIP